MGVLLPMMKPLLYNNGGPIITVQVIRYSWNIFMMREYRLGNASDDKGWCTLYPAAPRLSKYTSVVMYKRIKIRLHAVIGIRQKL